MSFNKNKLPTIATLALLLLLTPAFAHAATFVEETIYLIINGFLGLFVGLAGFLLNNSIQYTIIDFGRNYLDSGIGAAVESTWVIIRDLFNLTFIFGLIYIGFKMILNSDDSNSRRWLASLIMAALLVNFSLFITKTVVDFTNILATQIVVNGFSTASVTGTGDVDISGTFMNNFGLTSLFEAKIPKTASPWGFIFGTAIVFIVCMFVFAAGAILLFIRFGALLLYMIFSPLMFIGWVFPQLQGTTSKYWEGFLGRAFFAPIYVLLLYVSAKVIFGVYGGKTPNYGDATSGVAGDVNASFVNTFPPFIIGCIFLIASIQVASKLGVDGAGVAMKAGDKFKGYVKAGVGGATLGAAAYAGRRSIGSYGNNKANDAAWRAENSKSRLGRLKISAAEKAAKSSFDARQVMGFGKAAGIGEGKKGGYSKTVAERVKKDDEFANSLGKVAKGTEEYNNAKAATLAENDKYQQALEERDENEKEKKEINDKIAEAQKPLMDEIAKLEERRDKTTDEGEKISLNLEIDSKKSELSELSKKVKVQFDNQIKSVEKKSREIDQALKEGEAAAEVRATYSRQVAYIKQVEKRGETWGAVKNYIKGTVRGEAGEVKVYQPNQANQASANALMAKWGRDGSRGANAEEQNKQNKIIKQQQAFIQEQIKMMSESQKSEDVVPESPKKDHE